MTNSIFSKTLNAITPSTLSVIGKTVHRRIETSAKLVIENKKRVINKDFIVLKYFPYLLILKNDYSHKAQLTSLIRYFLQLAFGYYSVAFL